MHANGVQRDTSTSTTRIQHPVMLRVARYAWVMVFIANFLVIIANHIVVTSNLLTPCTDSSPSCAAIQTQLNNLVHYDATGVPRLVAIYYRPVLDFVITIIFMVLAVMIFRRSSNDWMSILVSAALLLVGARLSGGGVSITQLVPNARIIGFTMFSLMFVVSLTTFYLFPTGRFVPRWSVLVLTLHLMTSIAATYIQTIQGVLAPFSLALINGGLTVVGVGFHVYRYRYAATPTQRQQTKLVIAAVLLVLLGQMLREVAIRLSPSLTGSAFVLVMMGGHISAYLLALGLPIAIASAVLRYRLWDADLVINRSVVYTVVTLVMGLVFVAMLFLFDVALKAIFPIQDGSWSLIAATGFVVAAYSPLRRRVSRTLDLHIYGFRVNLDDMKRSVHHQETVMLPRTERTDGTRTGVVAGELRLEHLLGRGGMGEVYLGRHTQTGQAFAVKMLPRELSSMGEALERFERESQLLVNLRHPNIIKTYGAGQANGSPYYVMDYIDGRTLSDLLKTEGALPLATVLDLLRGVASGLDAAHAAGIVHRDVKPSNILLRLTDHFPQPVLTDFGIAKLTDEAVPAITRSTMMGTLEYVAPEQILAARAVDHRADIYSLGVVAYQMLTGATPFTGGVGRLVFAHLNQPPPDPCHTNPDFPRSVSKALLTALEKQPDQRYTSAAAFVQALGG